MKTISHEMRALDRIAGQVSRKRKRVQATLSLKSHTPPKTYLTSGRLRIDVSPIEPAALPVTDGVTEWRLAAINAAAVKRVLDDLKRAGFEGFAPMMTKWVTSARLRQRKHCALFPGYMFVGVKPGYARDIVELMDVQYLVPCQPARLRVEVDKLLAFQRLGVYDEASKLDPVTLTPLRRDPATGAVIDRLVQGDKVYAWKGPFSGVYGKFLRMSGTDRCKVLLQMLGAEYEIGMPVDMLRLVG